MSCKHNWVYLDKTSTYKEDYCSKCKTLRVKETKECSDKKTRYYKHWHNTLPYKTVSE